MELNARTPEADAPLTDEMDRRIIAAIQGGLPITERPYAVVASALDLDEATVIARIAGMTERGIIKRFGIVLRHHELGYRANAMVVWDVPDADAGALASRMCRCSFVTLCYRRPRRPPHWQYNLYCMIHGRDRAAVLAQIDSMIVECGLVRYPYTVLFSRRRFKQCGARYGVADFSSISPAVARPDGVKVA